VTGPARSTLAVGALLTSTVALVAVTLWLSVALADHGHPDLLALDAEAIPVLSTVVSASAVGAVLALRRPGHPVGWLFLGLGTVVAATGVLDGYGGYGALVGELPGSDLAAVVGDGWFITWFALVMWILHLTPTGSPVSPRWRLVAVLSTVVMVLWFGTALVWPDPLEHPGTDVRSPLAVDGQLAQFVRPARGVLGIAGGVGLVLGGASLLVRFRRAGDVERRQLRWLAVVVVPLPAFVALAFYAASGHPLLLAVAVAGFMSLLPIAAGLSISRYHLYDVDRILSRAVAWLLVSGALALTFTIVIAAAGRFLGQRGGDSSVPAVLGTLAAAMLATPAYRAFQEAADRRFDRRRYDAVRRVRAYVRDPDPSTTVEEVLREALHDPTLAVGYWVEDHGEWHGQDGSVVEVADDAIEVRRQGRLVARVACDRDRVDERLAAAVCAEATPELESAMLRARIGVQLAEVRESRARIAVAHLGERRRLERDLHDGAQQRLLAVAFELRAAQLNGERDRLDESVAAAVDALQSAVLELRELANGLHPAVLQDGGIAAAMEDLAGRFPVTLVLDGVDGRFPPAVEATAWFLACEAVTNAVKHAAAERITVELTAGDGTLRVSVRDDGVGGADPAGSGLRGLADRVEAVGGRLSVRSAPGAGTSLTGVLPCVP
jgi:signal transduction histidine kinase